MERTRKSNLRIPTPTFDYSERSDNTRVAPIIPQQVVKQETSKSVSLTERRKRVEEELRKAELAEARRKNEEEARERAKRNAEYYRKQREERERQRQEEDLKAAQQNAENEAAREKEREAWLEDINKHPENYSQADRDFLKVRNIAGKIIKHGHGVLAPLGLGLAAASQAWFDVKDELGEGVLNSISINGENIQSRIGFADLKKKMADAHEYMLDMQEAIDNVTRERDEFMRQNNYNPEDAALSPSKYADLTKQVQDYNATINSIKNQMNANPETKQLDDAYKQLYSIKHAGFGQTLKNLDKSIRDQFTYDQYKEYVRDKRKQEQAQQYSDVLKLRYDDKGMLLQGMFVKDYDRHEIQNFRDEVDNEIKDLQKDYEDNRKHLAESTEYWDVRESYKNGEAINQNAPMWSRKYWQYVVPGMIGSSASSSAQGESIAIQLGSAALAAGAAAFGQGWLSEPIIFAGQVISTPADIKAVFDENYGETGMKRLDNLLNALDDKSIMDEDSKERVLEDLKTKSYAKWKAQGISDKYLKDYLYGEEGDKNVLRDLCAGVIATNDPRVEEAMIQSTRGLQAQLDANNFRTGWETAVQKVMMTPKLSSVGKALATKMDNLERTIVDGTVRAASRPAANTAEHAGKYANGFRKANSTLSESVTAGYKQGAAAADALGLGGAGSVIGGTIAGTTRGAAHLAKQVLPENARRALDGFEQAVLTKYQKVYDKLMPTKEWAKVAAKYGVRTAKATAASSMSEAAEEAVQYLNEKEDFASRYGWDGMSWFDRVYNDIRQGGRVLNSYLSLMGLSESEMRDDQEYWANVKGGFVLGGGHTAVISAVGNVAAAANEARVANAIMESSVLNRELSKINRAQYTEFARQAMAGKSSSVLDFVHRMQQADSRREQPEYTQEDYDEHIKAIQEINALTKSKDIRKKLEDSGIAYGTEKYAHAIADIYNLNQQARENNEQRSTGSADVTKAYLSKENSDAIYNAAVEAVNNTEYDHELTEEERNLEILNKVNQTTQGVRVSTRLKALLNLKSQIDSMEGMYKLMSDKFGVKPMRPDAKTIRKNIDKQIEDAKSALKELDPDFTATSDNDILDYIDGITAPITGVNYDSLIQYEQANALLNADAAVIKSYQDQVGKKNYSRRIDAIMEANKSNGALNWMVNDIFEGDAVTMLMSTLEDEAEQQSTKEEKAAQNEDKASSEPFGSTAPKAKPSLQSNLAANKQKYEERKAKAKERYQRRKDKYNKYRRSSLGVRVPFEGAIVAAGNELIKYAEQGVYKFAQFVEDIKDISDNADLSDVMSELKRIYIKQRAKMAMKNPEALANMDSAEELSTYTYKAPSTDPGQADVPTSPLHQQIQKRINEDNSKIIDNVSSHYDVFVSDNGTVTIYHNTQAIEDSNLTSEKSFDFREMVDALKAANTSDYAFKNAIRKITEAKTPFELDEYLEFAKYRDVDGIEEAIVRNILTWETPKDVQIGIKAQNAVVSVLLGNGIDQSQYPEDIQSFIADVIDIKQKLEGEGLGLTILSTPKYIYGKDNNGNNIAVQADIIAADSNNKIYAIDVRSSSTSVLTDFDKPFKYRRSKKGQTEALLNQVEQIIRNKFKKPVAGLYLLPVIYNDQSISIERQDNGNALYPIKTTKTPQYSDNLEEQKSRAKELVDSVNERINEYNSYLEEANKYGLKYGSIHNIELQEYTTVDEYSAYMDNIHSMYDDIEDKMQLLANEILKNIDIESNVFVENLESIGINDIPTDAQVYINRLEDACKDLDAALRFIPIGKITTKEEKEDVEKIYNALFEAQKRLSEALESPDLTTVDLTREEELIAAAMEEIVKHPESFGSASIFMQRWWLNSFLIGSSNNTSMRVRSEAEQFSGYINTINSWVNTLHNHVVGELDNHRALQVWYSTLLNNYFSKLLANARAFAETQDQAIRTPLNIVCAKGDNLIQQFNNTWGAPTDEQFDGEPVDEVDRINRMPVKWADLYGPSMTHSPAPDAMVANREYYWMSNAPGFVEGANVRFYISKGKKYVNPSTGLSYEIKPGDVAVYIEYQVNGRQQFVDLPLLSDIRNYPNPSQELIERIAQINRGNIRFAEKIRSMLDYIKTHPEYTIYTPLTADKGSIDYSIIGETHNVSEFLFTGNNAHDLFTIELSASDNVGMLVTIENEQAGTRFYDIRTGANLKRHLANYNDVYLKGDMAVASGMLIYMYDTGNGQHIGVPMPAKTIGREDAAKLAYLINLYLNGQRIYDGYDIMVLLKLRLYIRDPQKYHTKYNRELNMIIFEQNGINIGGQFYNIVTQKQDIIDRIAQMSNVIDSEQVNQQILYTNNGIFDVAYRRIKTGSDTVQLPNGFTLTRDDFEHEGHGTTLLGYMMRNGIIYTRAKGAGYKQINFGNPVLVRKEDLPGMKVKPTAVPTGQAPIVDSKDPFDFDFASYLKMDVEPSAVVNRTEEELDDFKKSINDYFKKVLGDNAGKVIFSDELDVAVKDAITRAAATPVTVGVTNSSLIELSKYAPEAVGPHEAFHKIMELLLPDDQRKSFYQMYKDHERSGRVLDNRAIAEGLCDLFVDYTTGVIDAKAAPWYKKVFKWFDVLKFLCATAWNFGPKNTWKMFTLWRNINAGEYAKPEYQVTQERIERFDKLFPGGLHYEVKNNTNGHTAKLQYIADSGQLQQMVRSLGYYIMEQKKISDIDPDFTNFKIDDTTPNLLLAQDSNGKSIMDNLCGIGLPEDQLTVKHLAFREIFESREEDVLDKKGKKIATTKVYPNFDAISNKVAEYISVVCGEYTGKVVAEDETEESDLGENVDVQNLNIDKYDKASYEINKLEGTTKRVKLFFATIPYTTRDASGKIILDTSKNFFGTPTYMPIDEVYNKLVNDLHDVKSVPELYQKLKKLAAVSTMHHVVLGKLHELVTSMYSRDKDGKPTINYDLEQFAIQIVNTLSSQKMDFVIANAKTLPNSRGKEIRISQSSLGRDTYQLPKQWTKFLLSGQVSVFARTRAANGDVQFKDGKRYPNKTDIFSKTVQFVEDMRQALSMSGVAMIDGVEYNVDALEDIARLKKEFVSRLHQIGIIVSEGAIDHMLMNNSQLGTRVEDRDLGKGGLLSWLTLSGDTSINAFLNRIGSFVFANGTINQAAVKAGYTDIGFVKDLAKWQAAYNRVTVDNRTLALNGKELHSISQNNAITRTIDALNTQDMSDPLVRTLTKFGFNLIPGVKAEGSILLKGILRHDPNQVLVGHTYIGFKTDNKGDTGSEYTEEATVDDYMAKLSMLQEGYMVFPTLADKSTWMIISGVDIPGIQFTKTKIDGKDVTRVTGVPTIRFFDKMPYIVPSQEQLNQMIEYAHTERLAIQRCMADLGYEDIPGYEDEGRTPIPENAKVNNYHTPTVVKRSDGTRFMVEPNGTRFLGLTLITVKEDGAFKTYSLNEPHASSVLMLKRANDLFFSKSPEEQADIMALTLAVQTSAEIRTAEELGIVRHETVEGQWNNPDGTVSKYKFTDGYFALQSEFLNQDQIEALTSELMATLPHKEFGTWQAIPSQFSGANSVYASRAKDLLAEKQFRYRTARGLAIAALLNDVMIRHMISAEEALRCFIGHPGFFKVRYNDESIVDSAYDIQKRIGGLISTGEDNVTRLPGMPLTYTVAECNDYEVASTSNIATNLEQMFVNGAVREMYAIKTDDWTTAYEKPLDKLIEEAPGDIKDSLEHARLNGKKFAKSFTGGINVADGAAYITDTMCENLLRMRGAYNEAVREAFNTLRLNSSWMQKREAYKTIYDAVNIVPYKYTAYGFRDHILNGEEVSDVAVPYYDKFALFPIFPDMATGNLDNIYQKMKDEKVDELLMTSAVKVGSQGAVSYNGKTIEPKFNKYEQNFADLRRQLNTDPEEGDEITAGTLMIKIALQNLRLERENYIDTRTGEKVSGRELLKNLMLSINQLAINGALEIKDMFCYEGTNTIDPEKLSKYLIEQLGTRNATKAITDFIQVTEDENGVKKLVGPLAATTDSTWIESIVISTVNKHVIDITTPGSSFTQRSIFAMEGKGKEGEGLIQSDATMSKTINNGEKLQMINEDGSMDAVITMDYFDEKLFRGKLSGMSFEEKRKWLFDHNIIGKGAKANTIGYRIPTQAQSSIHALRFVDVIPAGKASIILPEEFTKITGSDKHINVRTLKNSFNCWEALTLRRGLSAAKTLLNYVGRVRFND